MGQSCVRCPSGYNRGGGDRAGLSHQSQSGGGSEVTLAPHLVQNTLIGERRGWSVMSAVGGQTRRLLINIDPETRGLMRAHQRVRARVGARVWTYSTSVTKAIRTRAALSGGSGVICHTAHLSRNRWMHAHTSTHAVSCPSEAWQGPDPCDHARSPGRHMGRDPGGGAR